MKNKAQLGVLQIAIVSIIVTGVILATGFIVLEKFRDIGFEKITSSVINESVPIASLNLGTYLANNRSFVNCFNDVAISNIFNGSTSKIINSANYTVDAFGFIKNASSQFIDASWKITYTYTSGSSGCESLNTTIGSINVIPSWLVVIIILFIVVIILAIVLNVLPIGRAGGEEVAYV